MIFLDSSSSFPASDILLEMSAAASTDFFCSFALSAAPVQRQRKVLLVQLQASEFVLKIDIVGLASTG